MNWLREREYARDVERLRTGVRANLDAGDPVKLHFGCHLLVLDGWFNVDINRKLKRQLRKERPGAVESLYIFDSAGAQWPIPDDSVDVIFHEDFLEHLEQKGQFHFLAEAYRVLKDGAVHRINTPNLGEVARQSDFNKGAAGLHVGEWDDWGHRNVLTEGTLREMAEIVGYSQTIFGEKNKSVSELVPQENRPGPDRQMDGNIFADLIK